MITMLFMTRLPIEKMKLKVKDSLRTLELAGMASKKNKYQELLNSIVQVRIGIHFSTVLQKIFCKDEDFSLSPIEICVLRYQSIWHYKKSLDFFHFTICQDCRFRAILKEMALHTLILFLIFKIEHSLKTDFITQKNYFSQFVYQLLGDWLFQGLLLLS